MSTEPVDRPSARIILIGPGRRMLLFRGGDPSRPADGTWWFTPGGGVDPGETLDETARRELWEETGLVDVEWSGVVARREVLFPFMGTTYRSLESFYVAHTPHLEVAPAALTALEEEANEEYRWLDASAIDALPEPVYPSALSGVLDRLGEGRYPASPWLWTD